MKNSYVFLCIVLLTVCCHAVVAQKIIKDRCYQAGENIRINYIIKGLPFDSYMMIECYVSTDEGKNFVGPLAKANEDVGKVISDGPKSILWHVSEEMPGLEGRVSFEVRGDVYKQKLKAENLLMYNVSGSSYAGLMYGRVRRWGGYVRGKTNLSTENAPYECNDAGQFNYQGDDYYTVSNQSRRSRLGITAGVLYRASRPVYLYTGAGYGYRRLMWQAKTYSYSDDSYTGDIWGVNPNHSAEGVEVEAGGIVRYKRLALSAGVNTIGFSFFEANAAIGLFF